MNSSQVISTAQSQVGYHEKVANTPTDALYPFRNVYDGSGNWTKFHNDLGVSQGQAWCGFFCYWVFFILLNRSAAAADAFLHGISYYGGAVSSWANAFTSVGQYHEGDAYVPKPGDVVIFSDTGVPWSHCEFVVDVSGWPSTISTIGGNTRNPDDPGSQAEGMWVAYRTRNAAATTGFHVRGYCEVVYDESPTMPYLFLKKRRIGTAFG